MAAPLVSGEAALVRAVCPGLSAAAVARRVARTATPLAGIASGRIDALSAVTGRCGDDGDGEPARDADDDEEIAGDADKRE